MKLRKTRTAPKPKVEAGKRLYETNGGRKLSVEGADVLTALAAQIYQEKKFLKNNEEKGIRLIEAIMNYIRQTAACWVHTGRADRGWVLLRAGVGPPAPRHA